MSEIQDNILRLQDDIATTCAKANRDPSDVTLVAVSKRKPSTAIVEAMALGVLHFGENRVEEAMEKIPAVANHPDAVNTPVWHMIGHIQSRKAKYVVPLFDVVHSVDSLKIAEKLSDIAMKAEKTLLVMLEINISGEDAKYGFDMADWQLSKQKRESFWQVFLNIIKMPNLAVNGLMTMAPYSAAAEKTRPIFASLASLREELASDFEVSLPDLSMGMTNDYRIAIEEGATIVRIGRAIFGERNYT